MSIQVISSEAEVAKAANVSTDQTVVAVPSVSKKVSAQVAQKANAKKAVLDDLAKKEQEEEARQAQLAEAAAEEAVAEEVAQDEQAVEAAQTIAAAAETLDASAQEVAAVIADNPLMFAQAGAAAAGGGAAAGGISTAAIVAGVAVVGVAAAASSSSDSPAATAPAPGTPDPTPPGGVVGQTFTLTSGVDVSGELLGSKGTTDNTGDDTFVAVYSALTANRTLDVTDQIDGGEGTDTIRITLDSSFGGFSANSGFMKNIENVEITNTGTVARTFTAGQVTDVNSYTLNGSINLASLASVPEVTAGARTSALTLGFTTAAVEATTNALTLNITDFGTADNPATTISEEVAVAITAAGIETLNLNVSGTNVVNLDAVDPTSGNGALNISGSGSVKVTSMDAALKTIDASSASGVVDLNTAGGATSMTSISLGSGDDILRIDSIAADIAANAVINGGSGDDTMVILGANATTTQFEMTSIETIKLGTQAGVLTFSTKLTSGVTDIVALGAAATEGALNHNATFAGFTATDLTVEAQGANANTPTILVDNSGAIDVKVTTPATAATTTVGSVNKVNVTGSQATSGSLTVDSKMDYEGVVTLAKATSVDVAINGMTSGTAEIDAAVAQSVVISAVAQNSALKLTTPEVTDLRITNTGTLTLATSDLSKVEGLTVAAAKAFTGVNMVKLNSATFTGAGAIDIGNVGATDLAYGVTVTANGAASFDIDDMKTDSNTINLTLSAITGAVDVQTVDAGTSGTVNITIAAGTNVGFDQRIVGRDITIDVSDVLGTVTHADTAGNVAGVIAVGRNLTYIGTELAANSLNAGTEGIQLTGSAQTIHVTGGLFDDSVTVTGATTTTAVTLVGDLSLGTDAVVVDLIANNHVAAATLSLSGLSNYDAASISVNDVRTATLTLGGGVDTVIFASTHASATVTINGFTIGTGGDKLNLDAAVAGTAVTEVTAASATYDTGTSGVLVADFNISGASATMTAAALFTAVVGDDEAANITDGETTFVLVTTDATNSADAFLFKVTAAGGAGTSDVTFTAADLVATLKGLTDLTSFEATNFVLA